MTTIVLDVPGIAQPQGNKTPIVRGGRAVLVEGKGNARTRVADWRRAIADAGRRWLTDHPQPALDEPIDVTIRFAFPLPAGDQHRTRHTVKPDVDKLTRAVFDSLVAAGLIVDDSRIWALSTIKVYARNQPPGAHIEIRPCGNDEADDRAHHKARRRCEPTP